jgi:alpha-beta hydrolase superfamily lysophospholipase
MTTLLSVTDAPAAQPPAPLSPAERLGVLLYRMFQALPFNANPDDAFLKPGADAAHTVTPLAIPLDEETIPGCWFEPKHWNGAAVLLVHGTGTEALSPYMFYMQGLLERGIGVMTLELDGHGHNPRPFDHTRVTQNVPAALRVLFALPGVAKERVGILGVSLGGACALHAAADRQDIRAVAVVGLSITLHMSPGEQFLEFLGILSPHGLPIAFKIAPKRLLGFLLTPIRVAQADGGVVNQHILDPETLPMVDATLRHLDPLGQIRRLANVPLLVLTGAWDHIAPVSHARALHAEARGPATLAVVQGRNHFTIAACPKAAQTLADWFDKHLVFEPVLLD